MAIQMRQGNEVDFDAEKMIPGEWAVSKDARIVRMCFSPGVVIRMATYEAFEADMGEIRDILSEAKTVQEAVQIIQSEINNSEIVVEQYSTMSKSYAVGGTGSREEEDTDNAKYYYDQAKRIAQGVNGIVPMGTITFEELPTEGIVNNAMYNISNAFTSDERFNDGGGVYYGAGNNVVWTASGKWDVTAASGVTGIKGENEIDYRQGNVNITRDNIGLGDDVFGTADISSIGDGTVKGAIAEHDSKFLPLTGGTLSGADVFFYNGKGLLKGGTTQVELASYSDVGTPDNQAGDRRGIIIKHSASETDVGKSLRLRDLKDGATTFYTIYGEHNKPSGSYTGNGSATARTINTGGIGSVIIIREGGKFGIFTTYGGVIFKLSASTIKYIYSDVTFKDGVLSIATTDGDINYSGANYLYQVL